MKEIPILMTTPMVQAIPDGRKTQTRRTKSLSEINKDPDDYLYKGIHPEKKVHIFARLWRGNWVETKHIKCPYGEAGDVLWVRETHYAWGHWTLIKTTEQKSVKKEWHFNDLTLSERMSYLYENCPPDFIQKGRFGLGYFKRPSIFMPKEACRIKLLVKDIRVERLNDISGSDAIAEGIESSHEYGFEDAKLHQYKDYNIGDFECDALGSYYTLWTKINGKDSWNINPWVWVIVFEEIKNK
jgi:hypothetical protein